MKNSPKAVMTKSEKSLRDFALAFPETTEDFPWGHRTFKVNKKAFVFMGTDEGVTGLSVKLPESSKAALKLRNSFPTPYGMGKHGWVSMQFDSGDDLPMDQLKKWIEESFRAVAPKTLLKKMDGVTASPKKKPKPKK